MKLSNLKKIANQIYVLFAILFLLYITYNAIAGVILCELSTTAECAGQEEEEEE